MSAVSGNPNQPSGHCCRHQSSTCAGTSPHLYSADPVTCYDCFKDSQHAQLSSHLNVTGNASAGGVVSTYNSGTYYAVSSNSPLTWSVNPANQHNNVATQGYTPTPAPRTENEVDVLGRIQEAYDLGYKDGLSRANRKSAIIKKSKAFIPSPDGNNP